MIITLNYDDRCIEIFDGLTTCKLETNIPNLNFTKQLFEELFNRMNRGNLILQQKVDGEIHLISEWGD
jgi:hypothetical protein